MKRLLALLALSAGCSSGPAPETPAANVSEPARAANLLDPADPQLNRPAPAVFRVRFETTRGAFTVEATRDWAPQGADRFYNLVRGGFFDKARFFRIVPGFVAQFGLPADPRVAAAWKEARLQDDPVKGSNLRGTLTFATAGPHTRTTQLFVNYGNNPRLDQMGFAPFAKVVEGMEVVDALNPEYREQPNQGRLSAEGEAYLARDFPRLDQIKTARIVGN